MALDSSGLCHRNGSLSTIAGTRRLSGRGCATAALERDLFTCQCGCGRMEYDTSKLVADHKTPHRGNPALFWDIDNLQCMTKRCHDSAKQSMEKSGKVRPTYGADGWPV